MNDRHHPCLRTVCMSLMALLFLLASCGNGDRKESSDSSDVLVMVGDSALTYREVTARIPAGLSESDSAELFDAIVRGWVGRILLDRLGRENVDDMDRIDRLTEEYRSRLIAQAYRKKVRESNSGTVTDDQIKQYYNTNIDEMVLDVPVVKGLFLKVRSDSPDIVRLRDWIFSAQPHAVDNLDKYNGSDGTTYYFFEDRWIDWNVVMEKLPERINDPDTFLASDKNHMLEDDGNVYFLHISAFVPSGEKMPYEYAKPLIASLLEAESEKDYERELLSSLVKKACSEGQLKFIGFNKTIF